MVKSGTDFLFWIRREKKNIQFLIFDLFKFLTFSCQSGTWFFPGTSRDFRSCLCLFRFVPGQRDNGTSCSGLSRDVPRLSRPVGKFKNKNGLIFFWGWRLIFFWSYVIMRGICNKFIEVNFFCGMYGFSVERVKGVTKAMIFSPWLADSSHRSQ